MPALPIINLPYSDQMVGLSAARAVQDSFAADQQLERDRFAMDRAARLDQEAQQDRANAQAADAAVAGLVTGAGTGLSRARAQPDMRTPGFASPAQQPAQAPRIGLGSVRAANPSDRFGQQIDRSRPIVENNDGTFSTERSITVEADELNGGKPTNIPSMWGGRELDPDSAIGEAIRSGQQFPAYNSVDEAVAAAQARSEDIGNIRGADRAAAGSPLRTARALRQDAAQALAGIPGMGGKALDLMMDGLDEEEKATATAMAELLDLADRDPGLAMRRAQQKGIPLDDTDIAILNDRAARARARRELEVAVQARKDELELAKIDSERAQAQQRRAEAAKAGRDELVPVEENGITVYRPRSEAVGKPVGVKSGAAGAAPSEVQTAQWLVKEGVANNAGDAWRMVREAKTNPNARAEMAIKVMELSGADPADQQARAQAEAVVDGLLGPATASRAVPPPAPGAPGGQPAPAPSAAIPPAPQGVDPELWQYMTPQERSAFE